MNRRNRRPRLGRLAATFALAGQLALVQPSLARADGDEVTALLLRAVELRRQHRNEEALAACDQAFAISPTPAVRANRALALQSLGHWVDAEREFGAALAADDPWIARNRASLEDAQRFVQQHLAWLTVDVDVDKADIRLDGEPLPQGSPTRVVAGAAVLEVHAPGRIPDIRRVFLAPSEHVRQQIGLVSLVAAPLPPVVPAVAVPGSVPPAPSHVDVAATPRASFPVWPVALGATGVVALGAGVYFGIRTGQDKSDELAKCKGSVCAPTAANDYSDAQTSAAISTVAFGVGAASIAAGALLWLLEPKSTRAASRSFHVAPELGLRGGGLVLGGTL